MELLFLLIHLLLPARILRAGIVLGGVCLCVRLSVRTKSRKLQYWSGIDVTW